MPSPVHVSRVLRVNLERLSPEDLAQFQLGPGQFVVSEVLDHKISDDGSIAYQIHWHGVPPPYH
jgi:hypothetical protein